MFSRLSTQLFLSGVAKIFLITCSLLRVMLTDTTKLKNVLIRAPYKLVLASKLPDNYPFIRVFILNILVVALTKLLS